MGCAITYLSYSQTNSPKTEGTNVVVIEPDVAKVFPDHDSVNQALRSLAEIIKRQKKLSVPQLITYYIKLITPPL